MLDALLNEYKNVSNNWNGAKLQRLCPDTIKDGWVIKSGYGQMWT